VSGNFTLDVVGGIIIDADGGEVQLHDGGIEYVQFKKDSNDVQITAGVQDGDIVFRGNDGGSMITAMTIDMSAAGFVGIGTTAPTQKLTVNAGSTDAAVAIFTGNDTNRGLKISTDTANSQTDMLVVLEAQGQHSGSYEGEIAFKTANTERVRVDKNGHLILKKNLALDMSTSEGIDFGAAGSSANTLDDYEEGTWSPTHTGGSGTGSFSNAEYTKVGRKVHIAFSFAFTSGGGDMQIGNLPFTSSNHSCGIGREDANSGYGIYGRIGSGVTTLSLFGVNSTDITNATAYLSAAGTLRYSHTYHTAS
jgi:hypothetical protein